MVVDGLGHNIHGRRPDQYWLRVNDRRSIEVPHADLSIESGLSDADGHTHVGCLCRGGNEDYHDADDAQNMFHDGLLFVEV
jgi:hypothetical protein